MSLDQMNYETNHLDYDISLFIQLTRPLTEDLKTRLTEMGGQVRVVPNSEIATAFIKVSKLEVLAKIDEVSYMEKSKSLRPLFC